MKVAFAEDNVQGASGLQDTTGFKIAANAHAFKMLSSGLYSDKVRAVLREIGCNAQDAHIAAGTPKRPIVVKLPNQLDNQFYVQDWGPGLSHKDVMELYSTYFASTKQQSNDFTGAFGLGSKSPFSYTDSFSVVSSHGGKKRTYSIYLDNKGAPTTSLMTEEDADKGWDHGVRVGFPVKPTDYVEFETKAQLVYRWFSTVPEIRGSKSINELDYRTQCEDYRLLRHAGDIGSIPMVLMGSVAYPLDMKHLGIDEEKDPEEQGGKRLIGYITTLTGLVVPMPIGSLQVAASREQLQYDTDSIKALKQKCEFIMKRIGKEVGRVLEEADKGGWAEMCSAKEKVQELLRGDMNWNFSAFGRRIGLDKPTSERYSKFIQRSAIEVPKELGKTAALKLVRGNRSARGHHLTPVWSVNDGRTHTGSIARLEIEPDTVVAYGPENKAGLRAKQAVKEGKYKQVLVVTRTKDIKATTNEITLHANEVAKAFGNIPLVELSELPAPPVTVSTAKKKKPKNWVPTLDATAEVRAVLPGSDVVLSKKLGDLAQDALYMCIVEKSSWGRTSSHYRMFNTTADEDPKMGEDHFDKIWHNYGVISKALALPNSPKAFARLNASEIKRHYLKELGWRHATVGLEEYARRKDVRDGVKALTQNWTPVIPDYIHNMGWVTHLAFFQNAKPSQAIERVIAELGLSKVIGDVVAETKRRTKAGNRGLRPTPPELEAYRDMLVRLRIQGAEFEITMKDSVTLEDMDQAFEQRFPFTTVCSGSSLMEFFNDKGARETAGLIAALTKTEVT